MRNGNVIMLLMMMVVEKLMVMLEKIYDDLGIGTRGNRWGISMIL